MIDVKKMFLKLTSKRYPLGTEDQVIELLPEYTFEKDAHDNYYIIIKNADGSDSDTMFTSHLDTIDRKVGQYGRNTSNVVDDKSVVHVFDGDFIKTDGNTNLGADDKAGTAIMLNMISEKIPGLYYFFMGEESGCVGSTNLSREYDNLVTEGVLPRVTKCISFDRRGYDSIITHQSSGRCASETFATELSNRLNEYGFWFKNDSGGVYTDSAEFTDIIPECTNISVGYFSEHTLTEKQDIDFLELLAIVMTKIEWETLPIERDNTAHSYSGKGSTYGGYGGYGADNWEGYGGYGGNFNSNNAAVAAAAAERHTPNYRQTSSAKSTVYKDNGKDGVTKFDPTTDDFDFDKWYNQQKMIGWEKQD